jgi:hypothetical protein
MSAQQKIPELTQRALKIVEVQLREKALKLGMNGTTEAFVAEQMRNIRKNWYGLPEQRDESE